MCSFKTTGKSVVKSVEKSNGIFNSYKIFRTCDKVKNNECAIPTMTMTNTLYQELEQAAKMPHALYRYILRCGVWLNIDRVSLKTQV